MPPANPSSTQRRASGSGLLARRKVGRPAWYIAMLSGASFSQPSTPWTFLPVSPFSWNPYAASRAWWSSIRISARRPIAAQSRNRLAWAEIDPLFMPTHRQCGPPAWRAVRLNKSQTSSLRS